MFRVARQPGAIVAADVHHQVAGLQAQTRHQPVGALLEMRPQRLRCAGDVEVFAEHLLLGHRVGDLDGRAIVAERNLQRIVGFLAPKLFRAKQAVTMRLIAQIQELFQARAAAYSAFHKLDRTTRD